MTDSERVELFLLKKEIKEAAEERNMAIYRRDPMRWMVERLGEDPRGVYWDLWGPEYNVHAWDGTKNPLATAWESVIKNRFTAVFSATGVGKTHTLARIVLWYLDVHENSKVYTSAPKKQQLELQLWAEIGQIFWRFQKIRPNSQLLLGSMKLRVDNTDKKYAGWQAAAFVAGVKASEESTTKAAGLHGKHMLIITEETPGMPWPTLNAFINTSTGEDNRILALGNPDSVTDPLSMFSANQKTCFMVRVSGLDHPNVVLGHDVIPGAVSRISLAERRETYGEEGWFYKSRGRGMVPEQSKDSLIRYEWIRQCFKNHTSFIGKEQKDVGWNAAGVDVANSDLGDKAAVCYGQGNTVVHLTEFQCPSASHLAYNLVMDPSEIAARGWNYYGIPTIYQYGIDPTFIGIDTVGVGASTINAFLDQGWTPLAIQGGEDKSLLPLDANGKELYHFASMRAQIYWLLAQDLMHGRIVLDIPEKLFAKLAEELVIPKMKIRDRVITVESKDEIKKRMGGRSPNLADSLAYWNYTRRGAHVGDQFFAPMA